MTSSEWIDTQKLSPVIIKGTHLLTLITWHSAQEQIRHSIREINRDLPEGLWQAIPPFWINCLPTNTSLSAHDALLNPSLYFFFLSSKTQLSAKPPSSILVPEVVCLSFYHGLWASAVPQLFLDLK